MEANLNSQDGAQSALSSLLDILGGANTAITPMALEALLSRSQVSLCELAPWIKFDPSIYARNRVALFPHAELLVMCWHSGQLTPIHDHNGSACAVKVLAGTATEISYRPSNHGTLIPASHGCFAPGAVLHSYDQDMHQLGNLEIAGQDLVTLHCYSPPLTDMRLFDGESTYFSNYDSLLNEVRSRLSPAETF